MSELILSDAMHSAGNYYAQAKEQWDGVILNNEMAKEGFAAAQIAGLDVVCYGYPGTGKTTFADRGHLTIGVPDEAVAFIEANPNITHEHLLGDLSAFTETTTNTNGDAFERTVSFDSKGIIVPSTEVIVADELNRLSPLGLNGLYKIMAERKAVTRRGVIEFPRLQYLISTMNPSETRQATFKVPDALASRHIVGLPFGVSQKDAEATHIANVYGWTPKEVSPVATADDLKAIRPFTDARSGKAMRVEESPAVKDLLSRMMRTSQEVLRDNGINDGAERQGMQVGRVMRSLALIRGQDNIGSAHPETIRDAYYFVTSARVGMLATNGIEVVKSLPAELANAA